MALPKLKMTSMIYENPKGSIYTVSMVYNDKNNLNDFAKVS